MPASDQQDCTTVDVVEASGARLRTATWGSGVANILLLHDGLGSIGQWRGVPGAIHRATGATVVAYDRAGHGASTPVPDGPWPADWLHREADVLAELLGQQDVRAPLLVGHSDGGSIALLHALAGSSSGTDSIAGVVALAPHSWVEPVCVASIAAMRDGPEDIIAGLARHHDAPGPLFEAWSGAWTSDAFAPWDIRPTLGGIARPVLVVQGSADEYATTAQLEQTALAIGDDAETLLIDGVGHVLHHQVPDTVTDLVAAFYDRHRTA